MSYGTKSGHGYGNNQRRSSGFGGKGKGKGRSFNPLTIAKRSFEKRSKRSQEQDLRKIAQIAPSLSVYLKNPERFDLPFIDMPRNQNETIRVLCRLASKEPCEIHVKDTDAKRTKKVKVVKKQDVKAEVEKEVQKLEAKVQLAKSENPMAVGPESYLPSEAEILAEAQRLWLKENAKPKYEGFMENVAAPTKGELSEEGYLRKAQLNLMTKDTTQASRQVEDYLQNIRNEVQKLGFDIVPISGFSSEDLSF